jgi:hypothetical protein
VSDSFFDKFIDDLVKGAQLGEGFVRGSKPSVEISRGSRGREEKLAGLGGSAAGLLGKGIGMAARHPGAALGLGGAALGALGGAAGAEKGHHLEGALSGGLLGGGAALGAGALGRHVGNTHPEALMHGLLPKAAALEDRYVAGVAAAAQTFGVKQAFLGAALPLLGSMFGGTAARAIGGKVAPKLMAGLGTGLKSHAFDAAGSMLGGSLGSKMAPPPPPAQPMQA